MGNKTIPSIYLRAKNLTQSYERRRRVIEQGGDLTPDQARDKVLMLASNLISKLDDLSGSVEQGKFDK